MVDRSFVLTWTLRGALHLVPREDLCWQLALGGPGAIRATQRRYKLLGLKETVREEEKVAIQSILIREGALVRSELARALANRGIPVAGQAIHHIVRFAALCGLVRLGAEQAGELTYVLLEGWLPAGNSDAMRGASALHADSSKITRAGTRPNSRGMRHHELRNVMR